MDLVFFIIFGSMLMAMLRTVEYVLVKSKEVKPGKAMPALGSVGTSEQQFSHKTLMLEKENFPDWHPEWYTKCDCPKCTYIYSDGNKAPLVTKTDHKNLTPGTRFRHERVVDGYVFDVPNQVPEDAIAVWDERLRVGVFTWFDLHGEQFAMKITPRYNIPTLQAGLDKQVQTLVPLRSDDEQYKREFERKVRYERDKFLRHYNSKFNRDHGFKLQGDRIGIEKGYK